MNAPDNGITDGRPAKRLAVKDPALILVKNTGEKDNGWSGTPFWWPILVTPKEIKPTVYAAEYMK